MIAFKAGSALERFYRYVTPKRRAYGLSFPRAAAHSKVVLRDLAKFCFADAPCASERDQGRRDVWLHIRKMLVLTDEELTLLYAGLTAEQRLQIFHPAPSFLEE